MARRVLFGGVVTMEDIIQAVQDDDSVGFCRQCGHEQLGCEPDARNYECEECGQPEVFGASELLIMYAI